MREEVEEECIHVSIENLTGYTITVLATSCWDNDIIIENNRVDYLLVKSGEVVYVEVDNDNYFASLLKHIFLDDGEVWKIY